MLGEKMDERGRSAGEGILAMMIAPLDEMREIGTIRRSRAFRYILSEERGNDRRQPCERACDGLRVGRIHRAWELR